MCVGTEAQVGQQVNRPPPAHVNQPPAANSAEEDKSSSSMFDDTIIFYNRVPKTASTSFMGVAYDLCGTNHFHVLHLNTTKNAHILSLSDQCELRSVIRFLNAKNNSPVEIHRQLVEVYGEKCMDIINVRKWCREFNEGRINVHDEQRSGRPSLPESTVARIDEMVRANRRIILEEIEDGLNEDCSHFSVHKIVSETLGYRKVSARWVPRQLKEAAGEWYNTGITKLVDRMKKRRFIENITSWSAMKPALYHGHLAFLNFDRFGVAKKPIMINILRKPLDRLVSYYYFLRNGDDFRPYLVRRRQGNKMTFDECVTAGERDCDPANLWLQVPFFCGHAAECWKVGSRWALEQAKHNLEHHYLLVGLTEQLTEFIALLEAALPRFFSGATQHFLKGIWCSVGKKGHLRRTFNKQPLLPETVAQIQKSKVWQLEEEFYQFAARQFDLVKRTTLVDNKLTDRGRNFMYEKIRPR
ncbi:HS2ST1 [Cordylochernes scorpioides]|uniref:HS2ST1 n=1 Tax=Cordylochernes scorpioides TaxID=51811 RepID=A0ABY6KHP4_9ARAC|nr:HS2ST1 [Cordylochernes scorpioides]